ncbi:hypothetical protein BB561_005167 [Smittium simulii]|uniref:Uncharacterized protein n=1 Tax=Smittium simulii TaxID=133385 RepID=A0A2T9YBQ2_9FUNG|nr:hypothetical protein BB561_005167 [Smittium simulii]
MEPNNLSILANNNSKVKFLRAPSFIKVSKTREKEARQKVLTKNKDIFKPSLKKEIRGKTGNPIVKVSNTEFKLNQKINTQANLYLVDEIVSYSSNNSSPRFLPPTLLPYYPANFPALRAGPKANTNYASTLSQNKDVQREKQFDNNRSSCTIIKARNRRSKKAKSWFLQSLIHNPKKDWELKASIGVMN